MSEKTPIHLEIGGRSVAIALGSGKELGIKASVSQKDPNGVLSFVLLDSSSGTVTREELLISGAQVDCSEVHILYGLVEILQTDSSSNTLPVVIDHVGIQAALSKKAELNAQTA